MKLKIRISKIFGAMVLLPSLIAGAGGAPAYAQSVTPWPFGDFSDIMKNSEALMPPVPAPRKIREYSVVPEQSSVLFSGTAGGVTLEGRFTRFRVSAVGDPSDITSAVINVVIDTTSTKMKAKLLNGLARKMLDTAHYPEATLKTLAIHKTSVAGAYMADVEIYLKGVKYPQTIPVETAAAPGESIRVKGVAPLQLGPNLSGVVTFDALLTPVN